MTVTLWIKSDVQEEDRDILFTRDPAGDDNRIGLRYDREGTFGGADAVSRPASAPPRVRPRWKAPPTPNTDWQHLAVVWEHGSSVKLYIDGVCNQPTQDSGPATGTVSGVEKLVLGLGSKGMHWDGLIDDVRIYSYALTADQIRVALTGEAPSAAVAKVTLKTPPAETAIEKKLVAWWKLDESEGGTVSDSSGGDARGALVGNPRWQPDRREGRRRPGVRRLG